MISCPAANEIRCVKPSIATVSPSRTRSRTASAIEATFEVTAEVSPNAGLPRRRAPRVIEVLRCGRRVQRLWEVRMSTLASADWPRLVRGLYLTAMAVFLVTIAIGILNGSDAVEFDHNQVLTHVHSGTLGWITLTILAAATWYARGIPRPLAIGLAAVIPIYVASFYYANPTLREIVGGVLLILIVWLVVWAWQVAMARSTLPALAIALGLTTFTYGAVIGVLRQVQLAGGPSVFPAGADIVGAHASAMVFSYLILIAM